MDKKSLRRVLRGARSSLCKEDQVFFSQTIIRLLQQHFDISDKVVAMYYPIDSEVNPLILCDDVSFQGALPRIVDEGEPLEFKAYASGDVLQTHDMFGMKEPDDNATNVDPDIIIVPMVGFDAKGHRLGYGKGYYDRTLVAYPNAITIGFAYSVQQAEKIPIDEHDQALDYIITEKGLMSF